MVHSRVKPVELYAVVYHLHRCGNDVAADGVAGHYYFLLGEEALHALVGHANTVCLAAKQLVGKAGKAVLLLQQGRDAHLLGCLQQRSAGISAYAYGNLGLEFLQYFLGLARTGHQLEGYLQVVYYIAQVQLALKAHYGQAYNLVSCGRHLVHFHLALGAHEKNLGLRVGFLEGVCNGYGREDMTSRAAAADNYS